VIYFLCAQFARRVNRSKAGVGECSRAWSVEDEGGLVLKMQWFVGGVG